jgi:hypothetical protein
MLSLAESRRPGYDKMSTRDSHWTSCLTSGYPSHSWGFCCKDTAIIPCVTKRPAKQKPMICFILVAIVLLGVFLIVLGVYALLAGQIYLILGSVRGPLARLIGLVLIVSTILCMPMLLRGLVGMGMNLGH